MKISRKVAFIMTAFPSVVETCVTREMIQLRQLGLDLLIFSLRKPREREPHKDARSLLDVTIYSKYFFSRKLIIANLHFFFSRNIRYLQCICFLFLKLKSPRDFLFNILVFPKVVYFASIAPKEGIQLLHGEKALHPATAAYIISKLTDIPYSFSGHAYDIYLRTTGLENKIRDARFVITCTKDNSEYLKRRYPDSADGKIHVIYHGLDLDIFKPFSSPACHKPDPDKNGNIFTIIAVGSLLKCKGIEYLIDACAILKESGHKFRCKIAGSGPEMKRLRRMVRLFDLHEEVVFVGKVLQDELLHLYNEASVCVLPALTDIHFGIPNVLLEAMAMKCPVICTPLPACKEFLYDGKNGYIAKEKDSFELADAIEKVMVNRELQRHLGEEGLKTIRDRFDGKKNAIALFTTFRDALN
jgi:colanic acid/amylovoran biosynthesis glycosyltransferase